VAGGDRAGDRLAVLVARVLPPMEALLRAAGAMDHGWYALLDTPRHVMQRIVKPCFLS